LRVVIAADANGKANGRHLLNGAVTLGRVVVPDGAHDGAGLANVGAFLRTNFEGQHLACVLPEFDNAVRGDDYPVPAIRPDRVLAEPPELRVDTLSIELHLRHSFYAPVMILLKR
jgi:hypothetical protein